MLLENDAIFKDLPSALLLYYYKLKCKQYII